MLTFTATFNYDIDFVNRGSVYKMKSNYPVIDMVRTGQKIKRIMQYKELTVRDMQNFLELSTPQSIYHWFEGRSLPTVDNLYALSELFQLPVDSLLVGNRKYECKHPNDMYRRILMYYEKMLQFKAEQIR